ncbi:acyltransferase [Pseudoflavonifractor sp. CLA-AP-H29]|uniref:Acyltransferase n=1 Tax=Pseudoflavonifractor intestinihominis TaxID=3133171 RepID=A0ABV1E9Z2_9FIRM
MSKQKQDELTVLSGIAISFVIIIHACASCLGYLFPGKEYSDTDIFLRTLYNFVISAVPIFVFISGIKFAIHDTATPYLLLLKKRLPRVLMSFFIINTFFWAIDSFIWIKEFSPILLCKTYISSWLGNTVAYPLWYIPMYCCVIIICPLLYKVISSSWIRFSLYLIIGLMQHLLASFFPILDKYPFVFVSYFIFFELGIIVYKYRFLLSHKKSQNIIYVFLYVILVTILSIFPNSDSFFWSSYVRYILFGLGGTLVYYIVALSLKKNKLLIFLGQNSYPLFLLHEPVIGRFCGKLLSKFGIAHSFVFVPLWFIGTLIFTLLLIKFFCHIKIDSLLWKFSLMKKSS